MWGFCVGICFGIHYCMSFIVLQSSDEEVIAGCFAFIVFRMSCFYKCPVAFPHSTMGWSTVCDCGIS